MSQHISLLEYIIRSKILCLLTVLFNFEPYNIAFVHHVNILQVLTQLESQLMGF